MKHQIAVITVKLNGRMRFVKVCDLCPNGKHAIEYYENPADATEFDDEAQASNTIPLLHNPFERELSTGMATIELKPIIPRLSGSFK